MKRGDVRRLFQSLTEPFQKIAKHAVADDLPYIYSLMSQLATVAQRLEETNEANNSTK